MPAPASTAPGRQRVTGDDAALGAEDVEAAFSRGRIASLLGAEGGHSIANSMGVLRMLHRLGVQYLTLTHNVHVPWADSATDVPVTGGLSAFGREVVQETHRLGMLVDLSTVAATTARDVLGIAEAPGHLLPDFVSPRCRAWALGVRAEVELGRRIRDLGVPVVPPMRHEPGCRPRFPQQQPGRLCVPRVKDSELPPTEPSSGVDNRPSGALR